MTDTKGLWKTWHRLDAFIWGFKYELCENPKMDDFIRNILDELKAEIERLEGKE